jgi:hypothetical protein
MYETLSLMMGTPTRSRPQAGRSLDTEQQINTKPGFYTLLILIGLAGLACGPAAPGGIYYASGKGAVTPDGLHRVEWEPFRTSYVKPGADLDRYDKVLVSEVSVSYKTPPRRGRFGHDEIDPNYALPDSAIQSLKRYFHKAFVEALAESQNFSVVETAGPDVLLISGHIVNLRITLPPERDREPGETVYASSSGQMTLLLDARDSISGEPLVRVGQAQAIQMSDGGWYSADPVSNSSAVREIFDRWASGLRRELDQFHALAALPPVNATPPSK